jgi:formylglycine-generating enzyme required for sulfatase activity
LEAAKSFCEWLTRKERKEGRLSEHQFYRLPTDIEWSQAVGLEQEEGNTPMEKALSDKYKGIYPWGIQWPPPPGVGNYAHTLQVDDFEYTSPVGSFPPNRFGLYDMGGNVRQWIDDPGPTILRGSEYSKGKTNDTEYLRRVYELRYRHRHGTWEARGFGFRCVLDVGESLPKGKQG